MRKARIEGVQDSVSRWRGRNSEISMDLCVCTYKCEKRKGERLDEVMELCE